MTTTANIVIYNLIEYISVGFCLRCNVEFIQNRHLPSCQNKFVKKATIYNSGPPRNSSLSAKVKRFAFKACLRCMGGDLSAVVASTSRRPRTSKCLVKVGRRPVQIATPAFQSTPGLPRAHRRSSGVLSTILRKSLDT